MSDPIEDLKTVLTEHCMDIWTNEYGNICISTPMDKIELSNSLLSALALVNCRMIEREGEE